MLQPEQPDYTHRIDTFVELQDFLNKLPETAEFDVMREHLRDGRFFTAHIKNPDQEEKITLRYYGLNRDQHAEQQHFKEIKKLLELEIKMVEEKRAYISSKLYGDSRFHMIDKKYDGGVQIEQTNVDEKWGSRVQFQPDEVPALLKLLLTWYLADLDEKKKSADQADEPGDLDDHPF